jgi:hypothetical protein
MGEAQQINVRVTNSIRGMAVTLTHCADDFGLPNFIKSEVNPTNAMMVRASVN